MAGMDQPGVRNGGFVVSGFTTPSRIGSTDVQLLDGASNAVLPSLATTRPSGLFVVRANALLPADFKVQVARPAQGTQAAVQLTARVQGRSSGPVAVTPFSTLVSKYMDMRPGTNIGDATKTVRRALGLPAGNGASRSLAPLRFLDRMAAAGRLDELAEHLNKAAVPDRAFAALDDTCSNMPDPGVDLGVAIGNSVLSTIGSAVDAPSALVGWVASTIGLDSGSDLSCIQSQLTSIGGDLMTLSGTLTALFNANLLSMDTIALQGMCSSIQSTAVSLPNKTGADLEMLLSDIRGFAASGYLGSIGKTQIGTSGVEGFLQTWIDTFTPQFYIDDVQQAIIHTQFDYYQQIQLLMMDLLVEADHTIVPGSPTANPPVPPSPPDYPDAASSYAMAWNQVQQQFSLLPFPTQGVGYKGSLDGMGCDTVIYDRVNQVCWGRLNRVAAWGTADPLGIPWVLQVMASPDFATLALPTMAQLTSLAAANSAANVPAYNNATGAVPNSPASPTNEEYLNALGFQLQLATVSSGLGVPFVSLEAMDANNWTFDERKPTDDTVYSCSQFFDLVNGKPMTVSISCRQTSDNMWNDIATVDQVGYNDWRGDEGGVGHWYLDALFLYQLQTDDPPVQEPSVIQVVVGASVAGGLQLKAVGYFHNLTLQTDITDSVFWSLGPETPATISNAPGSIGVVTWNADAPSNVTFTAMAQHGGRAFPVEIQVNTNATPLTTVGVNLYPRGIVVNGTPWTGQVYVQRINSDGSTIPDDTASFKLAVTAPTGQDFFSFTDSTGMTGLFAVDASKVPAGTTEVTVMATDSKSSQTDMMTIKVVSNPNPSKK